MPRLTILILIFIPIPASPSPHTHPHPLTPSPSPSPSPSPFPLQYTALIYLNEAGRDYQGGIFEFDDDTDRHSSNGDGEGPMLRFVKPKAGRLLMFTSGEENVHHVNEVTSGVRYAITIAFTCDSTKAASKPRQLL